MARASLELLSTEKRVQQVRTDEHGGDQAEQVGTADGGDDRHIRSIAKINPSRIANDAIPRANARMSMKTMMCPAV
jgi:hypothetical protein